MQFSTSYVYNEEQKDLLRIAAKLENRHIRCKDQECRLCTQRRIRRLLSPKSRIDIKGLTRLETAGFSI